MQKQNKEVITAELFTRLANNFYLQEGLEVDYNRIVTDSKLCNYILSHQEDGKKKYKVALVCICLNPPYWEFAKEMIEGAKKFFLPGHDTDVFLWSDMPEEISYGGTVFPTEPVQWPLPTLMRYSLFLQQEEKLAEYDYIFYCDIDMKFVGVVGDELLGEGLTAVQHPMYAFKPGLRFPLEPNPESQAYIKIPPYYYCGGIQGGKSAEFIKAMKVMKKTIDSDFTKNYVSIWNDESHWNKYLYDNPPSIVLDQSYCYPDSLIKEYYVPLWGKNFVPRLVTITKKFSIDKSGGEAIKKMLENPLS